MRECDVTPCAWVDATRGAAGDMLLGALLDAGAPVGQVREHLAQLPVEPVELQADTVRRHGLRACRVRVIAEASESDRRLHDVLELLEAAALPAPITAFAGSVFRALATAEAHVHGLGVEDVHFHEVGALDSIADIVGCSSALHGLGLLPTDPPADADRQSRRPVVASAVAVGSGEAFTRHGRIPLPAPAVLALLASVGAPILGGDESRELCTPTGAALLASLVTRWGDLPLMTARAVGVGAGAADPVGYPNVLRVVIGETSEGPDADSGRAEELAVVESTLDDLDPRLWPEVLDALVRAGALDAWATPVLMRKGRPGHVVSALVPPQQVDAVFLAMVQNSTTLGARLHLVTRRALARDQVIVDLDGVAVGIKRGLLHGQAITVQPEFSDAAAAARQLNLPIRVVLDRLKALGASLPPEA
jgi:pyridinium-3,5-bisthiocarboxylic acid mononucleotide nickel chelatase